MTYVTRYETRDGKTYRADDKPDDVPPSEQSGRGKRKRQEPAAVDLSTDKPSEEPEQEIAGIEPLHEGKGEKENG
jgi:hypothetical protein